MKKLILLIFLLFYITTFSQSQFAYAPNQSFGDITGMAIKDNYLYFGTYNSDTIRKINLAGSPYQIPIVVISNISGIMDLQFNGNELYISQFNGGTIKKIDISISNPVLIDVLAGVSAPSGFQFYNNYLYIGEAYGYKISRINLNVTNPIKEEVVTANSPWKIQVFGDELYVAETYGNKISKINLLEPNPILIDVVTNITSPYCMYLKDNYLYFENNTNPAVLSKIDLTIPNTVPSNINLTNWYSNYSQSRWIINNNYLYRSAGNSITRYDLTSTLGLDEVDYEDKISLYPNPAQNNVTFNQDIKTLSIYTLDGKLLNTQLINNQIDLSGFNSGIYLVRGTTNNGISFSAKLVKN